MPMISMLVRESRLPVGSSARSNWRFVDQGAGDGDALLLTAGKLAGVMVRAIGEANHFERLHGPLVLFAVRQRRPAVEHRQFDIFQRRWCGRAD